MIAFGIRNVVVRVLVVLLRVLLVSSVILLSHFVFSRWGTFIRRTISGTMVRVNFRDGRDTVGRMVAARNTLTIDWSTSGMLVVDISLCAVGSMTRRRPVGAGGGRAPVTP